MSFLDVLYFFVPCHGCLLLPGLRGKQTGLQCLLHIPVQQSEGRHICKTRLSLHAICGAAGVNGYQFLQAYLSLVQVCPNMLHTNLCPYPQGGSTFLIWSVLIPDLMHVCECWSVSIHL